jgi:hypothetical protein
MPTPGKSPRVESCVQRQANSVILGSDSTSAWHRLANCEAELLCGYVGLAVGIWYCTSSTRELSCGGARHDLVQ